MPAQRLSLAVTEAYRERLLTLRDSAQALARSTWNGITMDDLEGSFERWRLLVATATAGAQQAAQRASVGYIGAYVAAELDAPIQAPPLSTSYAGKTRDGRTVYDALESPLIGIRVAFKRGANLEAAMREGLNRATRMVGEDVMHAGRSSLADLIAADERIRGYERAVRGTCGACLDAASGIIGDSVQFEVHPGCACVQSPVIRNVAQRFPLPTGAVLFERMSKPEQDAAVGLGAAEAIREGDIELSDLVTAAKQKRGDDYIVQRPLADAL